VVSLTNTGTAAVKITGIAASQGFGETNTCNASLAAGSSCQISVMFRPSTTGTLAGTITISDDAPGSPQTVSLSGAATAAPSFSLGPASGSPTSQTITAGQSAKFTLTVAPSGSFSGSINLSCSVTPVVSPAPNCILSSSSVQIASGASQNVSVTVGTTAASTSTLMPYRGLPPGFLPFVYTSILLVSAYRLLHGRRRRRAWAAAAVVLLLFTGFGCGGSSSHNTMPGTPPGLYKATITATSCSLTSQTTLTVAVQ
jgi:Protein of unknown function (DUF1573)